MREVRRISRWRAGDLTGLEGGSGEGRGGDALSVDGSATLQRLDEEPEEVRRCSCPKPSPAPALSITRPKLKKMAETAREQENAEATSDQDDAHTDAETRPRTRKSPLRRVRAVRRPPHPAASTGAEQSRSQVREEERSRSLLRRCKRPRRAASRRLLLDCDRQRVYHMRGRIPFSSACEVCLRARSCKSAVRRSDTHENEVQLDQFFEGQSMRFLAVVHSKSFAIACVCVCGEDDREAIVANIGHWLSYFGVVNKECRFCCDAEGYVRTLWEDVLKTCPGIKGSVEQFAAGRHAPVAERVVRTEVPKERIHFFVSACVSCS